MKKRIRRVLVALGGFLGLVVLTIAGLAAFVSATWDRPVERPVRELTAKSDAASIARGQHLYTNVMLCWSCHGSKGGHSPDEPQSGGKFFDLSGIGPGFGYYYARNLTPDPETGIGSWSDGEVVRALREGLGRGGNMLFPVMPYEWQHGLSDDDALALVAYLRSMPSVRNAVPPRQVSFAAKALIAFGLMKPMAAVTEPVVAPVAGVTAEYGRYLAHHLSGCAECHMPRDPNNGKVDMNRPFSGGLFPFAEQGFSVTGANLTPHEGSGIGKWTEEQFLAAVRSGVRPDGKVLVPFMPWPYYGRWNTDDLRAIWMYLKTLPPIDHQIPPNVLTGAAVEGRGVERGKGLFGVYCQACHGSDGTAVLITKVPLREAAQKLRDLAVARVIERGFPSTVMPGFDKTLSKDQVEDLVTYVRSIAPLTEQ